MRLHLPLEWLAAPAVAGHDTVHERHDLRLAVDVARAAVSATGCVFCWKLRPLVASIKLRARAGAILAVHKDQLEAWVPQLNILRANVCVQVVRLMASVCMVREPSATVGAVGTEPAGVWICRVPISTIVANSVVSVTLSTPSVDFHHPLKQAKSPSCTFCSASAV